MMFYYDILSGLGVEHRKDIIMVLLTLFNFAIGLGLNMDRGDS
jgi:hypothetical protein